MILATEHKRILIHFDTAADSVLERSTRRRISRLSEGMLVRMRWYLEWTSEAGRTIHVLVPGDLEYADEELVGPLAKASVIRYRDEGDIDLHIARRRGFTFIINGNQFPIVHWRRAVTSAQRQNTDVVVFGPTGALTGADFPESVLVDVQGQVIRFKRHYSDSPGYADRWTGDAAFLVVRSEHAHAVAAHIVVRGWGLDSIGALVRRFGVRWLSDHGALSDDRPTSFDLMELSGNELAAASGGRAPANPPPRKRNRRDNHENIPRQDDSEAWSLTQSWTHGPADVTNTMTPEYTVSTGHLPEVYARRTYLIAKRTMDIVISATALLVLFPFLVLVAVLIKLTSRGPVFYAHTRQGLCGKEFPCLKFRSMKTGADAVQAQLRAQNEVDGPQFKMRRDPRVTRLGYWLRKTNIDELPQLINVLLGQMSLVGPRPSPDQENQYCPAWRRARLSTKPGITGLWQVLRNREECASDFQEWIYYDVEYARHRCFWLDLQILFYTPVAMYCPRRVAPLAARLERANICAHSNKMIYRSA